MIYIPCCAGGNDKKPEQTQRGDNPANRRKSAEYKSESIQQIYDAVIGQVINWISPVAFDVERDKSGERSGLLSFATEC